ncbi:hypothetical protein [Falsiroseomonas ponticola]|uniref:hypothetical protein n=1 Tax=Falsiroseomonas ponticola TaxID=2786951 RepID=UPI001931CA33|nr:hypothetical protein [Roseomonas ponticola]
MSVQLLLSEADFTSLSPETQRELLDYLRGRRRTLTPQGPDGGDDFDWDEVIDLTLDDVKTFMDGCSPETIEGLKVVAEHGPIIRANLLNAAGITNYAHFQGRVTKRTRTVTKNRHAFLFGWDDWSSPENSAIGCGRYGVTPTTHKALRKFFGLD